MHYNAKVSYFDKREVLQQEYSQSPILPSPHLQWVVKHRNHDSLTLQVQGKSKVTLEKVEGINMLKLRTLTCHLRIEHGGLGVKRGALFKELYIYSCNYELFV